MVLGLTKKERKDARAPSAIAKEKQKMVCAHLIGCDKAPKGSNLFLCLQFTHVHFIHAAYAFGGFFDDLFLVGIPHVSADGDDTPLRIEMQAADVHPFALYEGCIDSIIELSIACRFACIFGDLTCVLRNIPGIFSIAACQHNRNTQSHAGKQGFTEVCRVEFSHVNGSFPPYAT